MEEKHFVVYTKNSQYYSGISNFRGNYSATNTITNGSDLDLSSELTAKADALILPKNNLNYSSQQLSTIKTWFLDSNLNNRLLWVAGASDFSNFYDAANTNKLLSFLDAKLRLDESGVNDEVSNDDGGSYRVVATDLGNGPMATSISENIDRDHFSMIFHGGTVVYYSKNNERHDLRDNVPENVEILVSTADTAVIVNNDGSDDGRDFYESKRNGSYPLLVVEWFGSNALIVSGSTSIGDYKNAYGKVLEKTGVPQDAKEIIDNIISYVMDPPSEDDRGLNSPPLLFGSLSLAIIAIVKSKSKRKIS